jgi:hypothetical protein
LLSLTVTAEADQEVGRVAVSTVQKMLLNLHSNPGEQKLRSIRVSNKAFQSKVAAVPGGVELLLAAGYAYSGGGSDPATSGAVEGSAAQETGAGAAEASVQELFLVHRMDGPGARRLGYTLYRYVTVTTVIGILRRARFHTTIACAERFYLVFVLSTGCRSCCPP